MTHRNCTKNSNKMAFIIPSYVQPCVVACVKLCRFHQISSFTLQATLCAKIGRKEVSTMVSTSDLAVTQGRILHQLTARALIRDWIEGSLAEDRMQHEVCVCVCVRACV